MGHENLRISSGQKEREIGLTSCGDEWVVPKSPLLSSGKSEMINRLRQKNILFGIRGKWPTTHRRQVWIFSHQCSAWFFFIFFLLFLPVTCGGGSGGAMEVKIEREKYRFFFFFFFLRIRKTQVEREREREREPKDSFGYS